MVWLYLPTVPLPRGAHVPRLNDGIPETHALAEGLSPLLRIQGWIMRATAKHISLYGWTSISFEVPVTLKSPRHHAYEEGADAPLVEAGFCVSSRPNAESQSDQVAVISRDCKGRRVLSHERRHTRPDRASSANMVRSESQTLKWTDL